MRSGKSLNVVRFTLVALTFGVGLVAAASACLPELSPLTTFGDAEASAPATGCGDGIIATNDDGGDAGESCDPGGNSSAVGCSQSCSIDCTGVIGPSGHCYFLADPSDYEKALTNCSNAGGHVVTIGSEAEAALVNGLTDGGAYHVGLLLDDRFSLVAYKTPSEVEEPGWPHDQSSCPGCFAAGADDAGRFAALDPDSGTDHRCLVATLGGWLQIPCSQSDPRVATICEREPLGQRSQSCGGPLCTTLSSTAGRKRYVISISPANAEQADQFCRGYPNGSLVVFESREEREELARELRLLFPANQQHPVLTAWIGLSKKNDAWLWDDGVDTADAGARPAPWANAQPAPDGKGHAYMRLDINAFDTQLAVATSDDHDANEPRLFVCQRSP